MPTITRVTYPCNCSVDIETDRQGSYAQFLLLNKVCKDHKELASTTHKPNHSELSKHALDLIEEANRDNIADYEAALTRCQTQKDRRDVEAQWSTVVNKNRDNLEEWNELVTKTHAFDK